MAKISPLGRRVARLRLERGLTQHQLARQARVGRTTISALESGARSVATLATLLRLSTVLDGRRGSRLLVQR